MRSHSGIRSRDGTASTLNGDDRWPDVLARRLQAQYGSRVVVVNQGIGGNRIIGPASYTPEKPFAGGPSAQQRLDRDILQLSGVSSVIWMEGTNDFGKGGEGATPEQVEAGLKDVVERLRSRLPGVKIIGATLTPNLHSTNPDHGSAKENTKVLAYNDFVRSTKLFDAVVDFYKATLDPATASSKRNSFRITRSAALATSCTPIAPAIGPWGTASISPCSRPDVELQYRRWRTTDITRLGPVVATSQPLQASTVECLTPEGDDRLPARRNSIFT